MSEELEKRGLSQNIREVQKWRTYKNRCPITFRQIIIYLLAWQPVFFLLPEWVASSDFARDFVNLVATIVPSIHAYAANSPAPSRVGLFFAVQWCLFPLFVYWAFRCWGKLSPQDVPPNARLSGMTASVLVIAFLGTAWAAVYLPDAITFDPNAFRANRVWKNMMHDYLLPNGLMAVFLPAGSALMIILAWAASKFVFTNTYKQEFD